MDFKEIWNKIKQKFLSLKEKVLSLYDKLMTFYFDNKKLSLIIVSSILVILICILLLCITANKKKSNKTSIIPQKLELSENLIIPDGPTLPRDYNFSRNTKDKWSNEDAGKWFTIPSDKEIESLSKSNNSIVDEIIGAAP